MDYGIIHEKPINNMISSIVDKIVLELSGLNFVERIGGIVRTLSENISNKDGTGNVLKTSPIYPNKSKVVCSPNDYLRMVPDSKYMSLIYFEELGTTIIQDTRNYIERAAIVRLIGWFNLPLINTSLTDAEALANIILREIPDRMNNFDPVSNIQISVTGQPIKDKNIFSKYSYDEVVRQYLIYPFDYFAIDLTIQYRTGKSCILDIELNPDECAVK